MANKVDLEANGQRRVSTEEGRDLAKKIGCPFIETSAAHRSHVDDVFHTLVREIRRHQVKHTLCSRNFQNVKLRIDFVEIEYFYSHSDFT